MELRGLEPLTLCMPCRCATSCATAPDGYPPVRQATRGILANWSIGCEIGSVPGTHRLLVVRREPEAAADGVFRQHAVAAVLWSLQRVRQLPRPAEQSHQAHLEAGTVEYHEAGLARLEGGQAVAEGGDATVLDLETVRVYEREALARGRLVRRGERFAWTWDDERDLAVMLWQVAHAATGLLTSVDLDRLKLCAGCCWLFLDASSNRSWRWCTMEVCGTDAKLRCYVAKRAAARNSRGRRGET